jgi:uroporphyrinogen-III synthase
VKNFKALIPDFMQVTVLAAVIGRTTAVAAMGNGIRVDIIAPEQTEESLAEAIAERLASPDRVDIDPDMHMGPG